MKKLFYIFYLLLIMLACISQKPEKQEIKFINEAVAQAKNSGKLVIIEFWAPDCETSVRLKDEIFENKNTNQFLNDNFFLTKVSPENPLYEPLFKYFKLGCRNSVIILDQNGNEIERTSSYYGNKDAYLRFLREVSIGKNLYNVVLSAYKKDTIDVLNNYLLANKLFLRYSINDAVKKYNNVLVFDTHDLLGLNQECRFKIDECRSVLKKSPEVQ
jgi:thioredoxin-related protein